MTLDKGQVTLLLGELTGGNRNVVDELLPMVYAELHRLAERQLRSERVGHTLNATALIHEAYLKLIDQERVDWKKPLPFFGGCFVSNATNSHKLCQQPHRTKKRRR